MTIYYSSCKGETCRSRKEVHSVVCKTCKAGYGPGMGEALLLVDAPSKLNQQAATEMARLHERQMGTRHRLQITHWPKPKK